MKSKVLIVDDEAEILEIFRHIFAKNYTIFTAKNAGEALDIVKNDSPHVVVTDIKMPGMSGVELLREVKRLSPHTEVIIMTGYASLETSLDALRLGVFDYFLKPFDTIDSVRNVINRALDKIKTAMEVRDKQETLVRRAFELSSFYDISKAVSNFVSPEDLLELLLASLHKIIKHDMAVGIIWSGEKERFVLKKYDSLSNSYIEEAESEAIKEYFKLTGKKIILNENLLLKEDNIKSKQKDVKDRLCAPVTITFDYPALIFLSSRHKNRFTEEDKKTLDSIVLHTAGEINKITSIFSSDQRKIQSFVDILQSGVIMINKNYELVMLNPSAKEILSSLDLSLPKKWGRNRCQCKLCEMIEKVFIGKSKIVSQELEFREKYFSIYAVPVIEHDGSLSGTILILDDLTKEKQLQAQLIQIEKLSSIGQLISGVAHELNNPLTGVLGYAQMLMKSDIDGSIKDNLIKISSQAERCKKIIQNLLGFVRKHKPEMHPVDINSIISSSLSLREYELKVQNINIERKLGSNLPPVIGDAHRLQQVFLNLLINAEQAMKKSGRGNFIKVKTLFENDEVKIFFQDNGPGISENNLGKIFDPFFTTKEEGEGTGLGLNISRGIIEEHGGIIKVESGVMEGTNFIIELPACEYYEAPEEKSETHDIPIERTSDKKILLVDDETVIIDIMTSALEEFDYNITALSDGEGALQKIEEERDFDLIILDLKMPGLGGKELYFIIKEKFNSLADRIIFSTGDLINPYTRSFLEETGNRYVEKPFTLGTFQQIVDEVLYK